jgi:flagellar hook-basal body complex protein FliE
VIAPVAAALSPLGSGEWNVGSVGSLGGVGGLGTAAGTSGAPGAAAAGGSFGSALTNAISSLQQTQDTASQAAQGLATGTVTDPTQAVTAVENASLSMDLAAQIQNKLLADENTIFQTQL